MGTIQRAEHQNGTERQMKEEEASFVSSLPVELDTNCLPLDLYLHHRLSGFQTGTGVKLFGSQFIDSRSWDLWPP